MPRPQKSAVSVRPEGAASTGHFLDGHYFFRMPDFSDETVWTINQGRSMPALVAVFRALHDQERRGTEESKADARGGRLTIGIKNLARISREQDPENVQTKAILRQLRFLERAGILVMHDGDRVIERDPATGRILKGQGRNPTKVIIMTLNRSMMRGARRAAETGSIRSQRPDETGSIRSLRPHALRDPKDPPSKEHPTKGVPLEHLRRREHPAHGGRNVPPPQAQKPPASSRPAEEPLSAEEQRQRATNRMLGERYAKGLGITIEEVGRLWKADKEAFRDRLTNAGIDWKDGKALPLTAMLDGPPALPAVARLEALKEGERYIPSTASTFAVRRQTTDSLTVRSSVAGEAAQALDGPPVSEDERKAIVLRGLDAYQGQAGLTAGEAMAGAGAGAA